MNFPENATSYYGMNITKPPFTDVRVRKAFNIGLDHRGIVEFPKNHQAALRYFSVRHFSGL